MALTVEVTKVWPTLSENGLFHVGVEAVLKEDGVEVRRRTFTDATNKTADVSVLAVQITKQVQEWINAYKTEKVAYNHAKMTALVTAIQNGLTV